jgi:transcription-repair coupling factor (superfamily II helicase)
VSAVKTEGRFAGIDGLLPLVYPALDTLMDFLPANTMVVRFEPGDLEQAAESILVKARQNYAAAREDDRLCVAPEMLFQSWTWWVDTLTSNDVLDIRNLPIQPAVDAAAKPATRVDFQLSAIAAFNADPKNVTPKTVSFAPAATWIQEQLDRRMSVGIVCRNPNQIERVTSVLEPYGVMPVIETRLPHHPLPSPRVVLIEGQLSEGFVWPEVHWALVTDLELFGGRRRSRRPTAAKTRQGLMALEDIGQGDLVVHQEHGIGRYEGLKKLKLEGGENDFLTIYYRGDDRLYLPVDRLNVIQ